MYLNILNTMANKKTGCEVTIRSIKVIEKIELADDNPSEK
jgi:hypothetical protein